MALGGLELSEIRCLLLESANPFALNRAGSGRVAPFSSWDRAEVIQKGHFCIGSAYVSGTGHRIQAGTSAFWDDGSTRTQIDTLLAKQAL